MTATRRPFSTFTTIDAEDLWNDDKLVTVTVNSNMTLLGRLYAGKRNHDGLCDVDVKSCSDLSCTSPESSVMVQLKARDEEDTKPEHDWV
jgi:hypothetical protein